MSTREKSKGIYDKKPPRKPKTRPYDTCPGCPEPGWGPGACYCD